MTKTAYLQLERRFKRLSVLQEAMAVLDWDMSTIMPPGGAESRAEQTAELKAVCHGILTAPDTGDLIAAAENDDLAGWQPANLREMQRLWATATALSEGLVVALSKAESACEAIWRRARADADFSAVVPAMTELLNLVREAAAAKSEKLSLSLYDALLNSYEPGGRAEDIDKVFDDLEGFLPDFLGQVLDVQASRPAPVLPEGTFAEEKQKALGIKFMEALGFDFNHGRLDISLHPFCGGTPDDVRITTRYDETDFTSSLMGVLHETGHALYERGLPAPWRGQPVGEAMGMSIHESQSLLIEMQVCRSTGFLQYAAPIMRDAFNGSGPAWEPDNLYRLYTQVKPDFIRVNADEVTYPAHVILRYRLERALIEGDMQVPDIPAAWNEGMQRLLGLTPPTDREGCLQDLHWYDGAWGYFPTYTLGAMTAAQLFDTAQKAVPEIEPGIAKGDFKPLFRWLKSNIHGKGSLLETKDLLIEATGNALDPAVFRSHLVKRYLES